jgi:hypothetical protein
MACALGWHWVAAALATGCARTCRLNVLGAPKRTAALLSHTPHPPAQRSNRTLAASLSAERRAGGRREHWAVALEPGR